MGIEGWIAFGRGPMFRLAFALMVFGLVRRIVLSIWGFIEVYRNSADRRVPWRTVLTQTLAWVFPVNRFFRRQPLYGTASLLFHIGLIGTPLLLAAHIALWKTSVGIRWPAMPQALANWLALMVVAAGLGLLLGRALRRGSRGLSRAQDYLWPLLPIAPFLTGCLCANVTLGPALYAQSMLLHVWSADLIMALLPFTRMAHCVLMPMSQLVGPMGWRFPVGAGDRVLETTAFGPPVWTEGARR